MSNNGLTVTIVGERERERERERELALLRASFAVRERNWRDVKEAAGREPSGPFDKQPCSLLHISPVIVTPSSA